MAFPAFVKPKNAHIRQIWTPILIVISISYVISVFDEPSFVCYKPTIMSIIKRASETIIQRLSWATSHKDQAGITKDLAQGKDISEVYGVGEAGLFDEFFYFLEQFGILNLLMKLDPKSSKRQSNVQFPAVILIYLMRVVAGLAFFWHIHPVILRSQPLMRLVGFNGRQVRDGTSKRGTKKDTKGPTEIRGPMCPDSIASYIQAIPAHALERLINSVIAILARHSFFPKKIHALLDSSEIQTTELCQGCGKVTNPTSWSKKISCVRSVGCNRSDISLDTTYF